MKKYQIIDEVSPALTKKQMSYLKKWAKHTSGKFAFAQTKRHKNKLNQKIL